MSADPYLRSGVKSGEVPRAMSGFVVGSVTASKSAAWAVGTMFGGSLPFATAQVVDAKLVAGLWPLKHLKREQASLGLGVFGMPGSTA